MPRGIGPFSGTFNRFGLLQTMNKTILQPLASTLMASTLMVIATLSVSQAAKADDQSNIEFAEGTVHIYCFQPKDANADAYLEAFPKLVTNLQNHADEGRVVRAHYLKELKHGIFIVVGGDTREDAVSNGEQLLEEQNDILESAGADSSEDACRILEVGPVAVLPKE